MTTIGELTNLTNSELADKVRQAHDNILTYGWKQDSTRIGDESSGLCIGSALAMAFDKRNFQYWDYGNFVASFKEENELISYSDFMCDNGKALTPYLREAIDTISDQNWRSYLNNWNDRTTTTEDMVLDVLMNTEKALREAPQEII